MGKNVLMFSSCVYFDVLCDFILLQVIVTTPMEMLKIQLQDAGRLGKRRKVQMLAGICSENWRDSDLTWSCQRSQHACSAFLLPLYFQNACPRTLICFICDIRPVFDLFFTFCSGTEEADAGDSGRGYCGDQVPDSHADHKGIIEGEGHCRAV